MCLGVPGKVISVDGLAATVDFWGVRKQVRLDVVDVEVKPGDYVLNHVGFAIRRIPPEDIEETVMLFREILEQGAPGDLLAAEVRHDIGRPGDDEAER